MHYLFKNIKPLEFTTFCICSNGFNKINLRLDYPEQLVKLYSPHFFLHFMTVIII